jgi:tetratricopeptide (TPR) repeat protein
LLLASLYISTKKTFEAIQTFESILAHDPKDEEALLSLIALELESGHKAAAERHLKPFLAQNPDSALGQYYWGRLLQETQRPRDALKAYEKAVDLRPGFVQAGTYLGFLQEELGLRSEALKTFVWLAQETDSTRYHKKLGQLFLDSRDYEKSLEAFSNSLRTDPEDLNTKVRVGLLQLETGRLDPALETFRSILKEAEDNETIRYYLGAVLFEKKRWAEAIPELARIPRESKLWIESLRKRLAAMRQLKQEVEAKKIATEIYASLLPDDAAREEVAEMTSQILSSLGEHKESDALLSEALANHPDSELLLYALAVAREKSGQWESAAQTMQKLIQRNPRHAGALNFVGYLWAEQGVQLPEAEALIRRALSFRQNDPFIMDSLAWVRFRRGAWSEALNLLEKARTLAPDESVIWEHLGDVLAKMGRFPEAKTHYEKALELGPERSSEENKLREKLAQTSREAENMCRVAEKSGQLLDPSCRTVLGLRDASPRQPASADAP